MLPAQLHDAHAHVLHRSSSAGPPQAEGPQAGAVSKGTAGGRQGEASFPLLLPVHEEGWEAARRQEANQARRPDDGSHSARVWSVAEPLCHSIARVSKKQAGSSPRAWALGRESGGREPCLPAGQAGVSCCCAHGNAAPGSPACPAASCPWLSEVGAPGSCTPALCALASLFQPFLLGDLNGEDISPCSLFLPPAL